MDIKSLYDVSGKVVLVTGGGQGVGEMVRTSPTGFSYIPNSRYAQISTGYVTNGAKVRSPVLALDHASS